MYLLYLRNKLIGTCRKQEHANLFIADNGIIHTRIIYTGEQHA